MGFIARVVVVVARGRRPSIGPRTREGVVVGIVVGIGIIVGSYFATAVVGAWATIPEEAGGGMDYTKLFSVPMWMAVACFVIMLALYPGNAKPLAEQAQAA